MLRRGLTQVEVAAGGARFPGEFPEFRGRSKARAVVASRKPTAGAMDLSASDALEITCVP